MALKLAYAALTGDDYPDAYARIVHVFQDLERGFVQLNVAVYRDEAARQEGKQRVQLREYAISPEDYATFFATNVLDKLGASAVSQGYLWLKEQQPDYAQAEDV